MGTKTYTIGEVAEKFSLPISTLRYYDKEGLFPELQRSSGIRRFTDHEIEALKVIECLKRSGLEIKDIRQFMQWCKEGKETYQQRRELFVEQKRKVEEELQRMQRVHDMLKYKCWFYEQLLSGANEKELKDPASGKMPAEIKKTYQNAFADH